VTADDFAFLAAKLTYSYCHRPTRFHFELFRNNLKNPGGKGGKRGGRGVVPIRFFTYPLQQSPSPKCPPPSPPPTLPVLATLHVEGKRVAHEKCPFFTGAYADILWLYLSNSQSSRNFPNSGSSLICL
jgi:hypothetical protein